MDLDRMINDIKFFLTDLDDDDDEYVNHWPEILNDLEEIKNDKKLLEAIGLHVTSVTDSPIDLVDDEEDLLNRNVYKLIDRYKDAHH